MTSTKPGLILAVAVVLLTAAQALAVPVAKDGHSRQPASGKSAAQTTLVLEGKSALFGPCSIRFGKGMKVRAKFGFTIWSSDNPDKVYMLNAENHAYICQTVDQWINWNRRGIPPIRISEVELIDKPTIAGQPCVHYFGYQTTGNMKVKATEFYCLQKAPCNLKAVDFWCKHYMLPAKYGFPVMVKQRVGNELGLLLDTQKIRFESDPLISFDVPKDYKLTKDKADFYFGDGGGMSKSDLESIFSQPLKQN